MKLSFSMRLKDGIIIALILVVLIQSYFSPKLTESRFNDTLQEMRVLVLESEKNALKINLIQLHEKADSIYSSIDSMPIDSLHIIYPDIIRQLRNRDSLRRSQIATEDR